MCTASLQGTVTTLLFSWENDLYKPGVMQHQQGEGWALQTGKEPSWAGLQPAQCHPCLPEAVKILVGACCPGGKGESKLTRHCLGNPLEEITCAIFKLLLRPGLFASTQYCLCVPTSCYKNRKLKCTWEESRASTSLIWPTHFSYYLCFQHYHL